MSGMLSGKNALVTGGARGIGAAIAKELAAHGANVAISYNVSSGQADKLVEVIKSHGVRGKAFQADQANEIAVAKLIADTVTEFGQIDILVNNAGVLEFGTVDATSDTSGFDRQYAINLGGVVAAIRAASPLIRQDGRIISISTGIATRVGKPGLADYIASKAAVEAYSKGAARDLGARGITVNVIAVGSVDTEMNPSDGPLSDYQRDANALGRYGNVEEIAAVARFLASPDASFITGAVIAVDGGYLA